MVVLAKYCFIYWYSLFVPIFFYDFIVVQLSFSPTLFLDTLFLIHYFVLFFIFVFSCHFFDFFSKIFFVFHLNKKNIISSIDYEIFWKKDENANNNLINVTNIQIYAWISTCKPIIVINVTNTKNYAWRSKCKPYNFVNVMDTKIDAQTTTKYCELYYLFR